MKAKCIKFSATWCGPCRAYAPIFDEVSKMEEFKNIEFLHIDVDDAKGDEREIMQKHNIRSVPTTLIIDENGELVNKAIGAISKADLITLLT